MAWRLEPPTKQSATEAATHRTLPASRPPRLTRMLEHTLPFGRLVDVGMVQYGEFICSQETADWLIHEGAMSSVNGRPVQLSIVDRCDQAREAFGSDNVIVHVYYQDAAGFGRTDINGKVAA